MRHEGFEAPLGFHGAGPGVFGGMANAQRAAIVPEGEADQQQHAGSEEQSEV